MNRYCGRLYRSFCLDFSQGLTAREKKEFLFYCGDVVPAGILERCESDFLKAITELQHRHVLLYGETNFLKHFLEDIRRFDLLSKLESFDVSRELIWLFEALITSRIRKKLCEGKFDIENGCEGRSLIDIFVEHQDVFKLPMDTNWIGGDKNIDTQLVNFREKSVQQSKEKRMTWELIPLLIRFAVECAVSYTIDQGIEWEKNVVIICNQMVKEIMPWITRNGGWKKFEAFISKKCKIGEPIENDGRAEKYRVPFVKAAKDLHQFVLDKSGGMYRRFQNWLAGLFTQLNISINTALFSWKTYEYDKSMVVVCNSNVKYGINRMAVAWNTNDEYDNSMLVV